MKRFLLVFSVFIATFLILFSCNSSESNINGDSDAENHDDAEQDESGIPDDDVSEERELFYETSFPASDGTKLSAFVWLPDNTADGKYPVLLLRTPYNTDTYMTETLSRVASWAVKEGYVFVVSDSRGNYHSEGVFYAYRNEFSDGKDAVDWVHTQPWCNGHVATVGASYSGFTALAAAAGGGKVDAVISEGAPGDLYKGYPRSAGGVVTNDTISWLYLFENHEWPDISSDFYDKFTNFHPLKDMDLEILGHEEPFWNDYIAAYENPGHDFWKSVSRKYHFEDICVPVLHIKALEEIWGGPIDNYLGCRDKGCAGEGSSDQYFIFGSNYHGEMVFDFVQDVNAPAREFMSKFLSKYVKKEKIELPEEKVMYRIEGREEWSLISDWPPEAEKVEFFLSHRDGNITNGLLSQKKPDEETQISVHYDPETTNPCIDSFDLAFYYTDPLEEDLDITGRVNLTFFSKANVKDTDYIAFLSSYDSKWDEVFITKGELRAVFRGDDGAYEGEIEPGKVYEFEIEFDSILKKVPAGRMLGLAILPAACGYNENLNTAELISDAEESVPVEQIHISGPDSLSKIVVPVPVN